jgi:uncharacterized membrane protein YqjE
MVSETASDLRANLRARLKQGEEEARNLGYEVAEIAAEIRQLAAEEVELGVAEAKEQVSYATRAAGLGVAAFVVAEIMLVFLGLTVMFALATGMDLWLAALITSIGFAVISAALAYVAYTFFKKVTLKPERMIQSLKEDASWARSLLKSSGI